MPSVYYPRCQATLLVLLEDWKDGSDESLYEIHVIPRRVEVERNSMLEADVFRMEIDHRDLPLDPRSLRQAHVKVYLDNVTDPSRTLKRKATNAAFLGWVDEPQVRLEDSGEVVTLEGRDYTGAFLDYVWGAEPVNTTRPLELVIGGILTVVPGAAKLKVVFTTGASSIIVADRIGRTKYAPKGSQDSAWQVIVDLCGLVGLLPVIELDTLHIRSASEFGQTASSFVYGENVARLTMRKKFAAAKTLQVRVRCWDEQAREAREGTYPTKPLVVSKRIGTDGKVTTEAAPLITHNISGTFSTADLVDMAQQIFERSARQQIEGELETREMESLTNDKLVRVANGSSLELRIQRGALQRIAGLTDADARRVLTRGELAMDPAVVDALLAGRRRAEDLATRFYVQTARHTWSRDEGYTLSISFISYLGVSA